ncbi:tuftelin 1b isoform X1 [Etheostoma cragini]|uniref:tuftelin 1b isoform X1 n=1 Tax=Etheostoma cragini TaxID=417921 RepID=UPI00155EC0FE|nr:tuftelin 1b isoform X1 [Etheostoma cragini]
MGSIWKKIRQVTEDRMLFFSSAHTKRLLDGGGINFSEKMSSGVTRIKENGEEDNKANVRCRRVRLTLLDQDQSGCSSDRNSSKESSIAVVLPQKPEKQEETLVTPTEEKAEVIKVLLKARPEKAESVRMLTDEVSQIQEVRYCLKTLREQMAARQNTTNNKYPVNGLRVNLPSSKPAVTYGNTVPTDSDAQVGDNQEESVRLREATKRLYAQLKEMDKRHQEERERLQAESQEYGVRLAEQSEQLQKVGERLEERDQQVEELQKLLGNMELENSILKEKMAAGEAELLQLKADQEEGEENEQRCEKLEKEVALLKEKIHHLDDMLKCQQRKVRHMIEQLQNSRTVIQERERFIRDLEERVAFLEAENREMHDHMEYFLAGQEPPPLTSTENKPEVVYSKRLTPTTPTDKALPFIKVIEINS